MPVISLPLKARWWFRSQDSGRLNELTYWLCALLASALAATIVSSLWRLHNRPRLKLEQAAGYADWVYAAPPSALVGYRDTFLQQRLNLVNVVRSSSAELAAQPPPRRASDLKAQPLQGELAGSLFNQPDIKVFPSTATFDTPDDKELTPVELRVFTNFSSHAKSLNKAHHAPENSHIERWLAYALGLSPDPTRSGVAAFERAMFDVPWIYVASKRGAIAVYPGTDVIADKSWDTTSRPWFKAAFNGDFKMLSKGLTDNDLLTVTYLDVLAKSPMLVRTYMYRFEAGSDEEFIICVDLHLRGEDVSGVTPQMFQSEPFLPEVLEAFAPRRDLATSATFLFGLALFGVLRSSSTSSHAMKFRRREWLTGQVTVAAVLKLHNEEQQQQQQRFGLQIDRGGLSAAAEAKNNWLQQWTNSTNIELSRQHLRAFGLWEVSKIRTSRWKLCGVNFETVRRTYIGTITLAYTNEILPRAGWVFFNEGAFSGDEKAHLRKYLTATLEENAGLCDGAFSVSDDLSERQSPLSPALFPDWLRAVEDPSELTSVTHQRAYVHLSSHQLDELYSKADVKAVITSGYLERLLNSGDTDFLLKGRTIARIISFPERDGTLNLTDEADARLHDLLAAYSLASSRILERVNRPISAETMLLPVYDFALLNDSAVLVSHAVSKATPVDTASGRDGSSTHFVDGYLSWRPADVEFYRAVFSQMAEQATRVLNASDILEPHVAPTLPAAAIDDE